ncbi:hypothetical protein NGH46_13550 [Staphylococcus xylosus]|uniref:hypothetical protein n=1 Tax=Staphylococcus xylosus TaxID=1288 RepID=UPI002DB6F8EB|nr:hypothetical protein [Staphylococcus xylosus]MEB8123142.1 hypothetical protein [Staphylococcus xylosus]
MKILANANKKANVFLGLDYLTFAIANKSFKAFITFALLYIVHIIFVISITLSIINMYEVIQIIGGLLLWIVITYVFRKVASKVIFEN